MKIGIIGGGIVGSTAAFYLSRQKQEVVLYDLDFGQATKAAAGIIAPWFSKRRNQKWYRLANAGAHFYPELIKDLASDGLISKAYAPKTTWIVKKKPKQVSELMNVIQKRQQTAPLLTHLDLLSFQNAKERLEGWSFEGDIIEAEGGSVVEGEQLVKELLAVSTSLHLDVRREKGELQILNQRPFINGEAFDAVILSNGPWMAETLKALQLKVDLVPQKGQLLVYKLLKEVEDWPLLLVDGEGDFIPHGSTLYLGATHEKDSGFDRSVDEKALEGLFENGSTYFPNRDWKNYSEVKVGLRSYTSDFSPFFGFIPAPFPLVAAAGLGASGLTSGPLIGNELSHLLLKEKTTLELKDYDPTPYLN